MNLNHLLASLPPELGLQHSIDEVRGLCELVVDGSLMMTIEEEPATQSLYLYSVVASTAGEHQTNLFATLLEAQLFGRELGEGIAFGFDRAESSVLIWRKLDGESDESESLAQALTEFINWAEHWHAKLNAPATEGDVTPPEASMPEHFLRA